MGRPTIFKKGAMSDAERQRRRRRRLAKEKRDAEIDAKRKAANAWGHVPPLETEEQARAYRETAERAALIYEANIERGHVSPQPPRTEAEELVRQIADVILFGDITADEIRAAFDAIFPKRRQKTRG